MKIAITLVVIAALMVSCTRSPQAREAKFLASGKAHMQQKDYGRAVLDFKNAAQAMPKDAEAYYQLGLAFLAKQEIKPAYASFYKATELNPKHAGAQIKVAEIMAAFGDKKSVEEAARRASDIITKGADAEAFDALAFAKFRLGDHEDAEKVLDEALQRFPTHLNSSVSLAKVRLLSNDQKGAEQALQQAVANDPKSPFPHIALGALYLRERSLADAEQQFRRALDIDPKNGPALLNLGNTQMRAAHMEDAERSFKRLSALPDRQYKPAHAIFLFRTGNSDVAIKEFESLAAADPSDRDAQTRLVTAYEAAGRPRDAEQNLNATLSRNPKNVDMLLLRSRVYLQQGKTDAARADLTQALTYRNESPDAHFMLAQVYGLKGNTAQQRQELGEALRFNPRYLPARLALAQLLLATHAAQPALNLLNEAPRDQQGLTAVVLQRGWALLENGQVSEARHTLDSVLGSSRTPEAVRLDATIRAASGDYSGARAAAEEILKARPDDVDALELLVRAYAQQKQVPAGVKALSSYAGRSPRSAPVQKLLGDVLVATGVDEQARTAYAAAITDDPNFRPAGVALAQLDIKYGQIDSARPILQRLAGLGDVPATLTLAGMEGRLGNRDAAIAGYRKVIDTDPSNVAALNNLAYLLLENAHTMDEGIKFAQKAQQLAPTNANTNDTLGWAYFRKGDYPLALSYLSRIAGKDATPEQRYHLAVSYIRAGQAAKGRQLLEAALKADPRLGQTQHVSEDSR